MKDLLIVHTPNYPGQSMLPYFQAHVVPAAYFRLHQFFLDSTPKVPTKRQDQLRLFVQAINHLGIFSTPSVQQQLVNWQKHAKRTNTRLILAQYGVEKLDTNNKAKRTTQYTLDFKGVRH